MGGEGEIWGVENEELTGPGLRLVQRQLSIVVSSEVLQHQVNDNISERSFLNGFRTTKALLTLASSASFLALASASFAARSAALAASDTGRTYQNTPSSHQ